MNSTSTDIFPKDQAVSLLSSNPEALEAEADWRPERQEPKCPAHLENCLSVQSWRKERQKRIELGMTLKIFQPCDSKSNTPGTCIGEMNMYWVSGNV
jgi:hypothetical protein